MMNCNVTWFKMTIAIFFQTVRLSIKKYMCIIGMTLLVSQELFTFKIHMMIFEMNNVELCELLKSTMPISRAHFTCTVKLLFNNLLVPMKVFDCKRKVTTQRNRKCIGHCRTSHHQITWRKRGGDRIKEGSECGTFTVDSTNISFPFIVTTQRCGR